VALEELTDILLGRAEGKISNVEFLRQPRFTPRPRTSRGQSLGRHRSGTSDSRRHRRKPTRTSSPEDRRNACGRGIHEQDHVSGGAINGDINPAGRTPLDEWNSTRGMPCQDARTTACGGVRFSPCRTCLIIMR
jgi:hypothetical protein